MMNIIIQAKTIALVELEEKYIKKIFSWRNNPDFLSFCTARSKINSIPEFKKELLTDFQTDRHMQFLIMRKNKEFIGTIYSYNYNSIDNYTFISVFIEKNYANKSYGIKSFILFAYILFNEFNLFKIYFDVYSYNTQMISILKKYNFSLEGIFIKQHKYKGKRFDVLRYGFYIKDLKYWMKKFKLEYII